MDKNIENFEMKYDIKVWWSMSKQLVILQLFRLWKLIIQILKGLPFINRIYDNLYQSTCTSQITVLKGIVWLIFSVGAFFWQFYSETYTCMHRCHCFCRFWIDCSWNKTKHMQFWGLISLWCISDWMQQNLAIFKYPIEKLGYHYIIILMHSGICTWSVYLVEPDLGVNTPSSFSWKLSCDQ